MRAATQVLPAPAPQQMAISAAVLIRDAAPRLAQRLSGRPHVACYYSLRVSLMILTRLGYTVIVAIIAAAAVAIAVVVMRANDSAPPTMEFARVIDFVRYGAVTEIEVKDGTTLVHFREDWDPSPYDTDSHTFTTTLPDGQDVTTALQAAGIAVNGENGLRVNVR